MRKTTKSLLAITLLLASVPFLLGSGGHGDDDHDGYDKFLWKVFYRLVWNIQDLGRRVTALEACDCEGILAPVCAASGLTYVNQCEARCAGAEIVARGPCEPPPPCGGDAMELCEQGLYCELPPGCDETQMGDCLVPPTVCPDVWAPVCGCDGNTYGNDCDRRAAGVALDHEGECQVEPVTCATNDECTPEQLCQKEVGECDAVGTCESRPEGCVDIYAPVCGCDDQTYPNACEANAAGVSVAAEGECGMEPEPVVCTSNDECAETEFCLKALASCEATGTCQPRPVECSTEFAPVCGCDSQTYSNPCQAHAAGVSVDDESACGEPDPPVVPKVRVCHRSGSSRFFSFGEHTIEIAAEAVDAHMAHGDHYGACEDD